MLKQKKTVKPQKEKEGHLIFVRVPFFPRIIYDFSFFSFSTVSQSSYARSTHVLWFPFCGFGIAWCRQDGTQHLAENRDPFTV